MSLMSFLSLIALVLPILAVRGEKCGRFTCRPELNGTCEDCQCTCPANQTGDARLECVDPATACLCTFDGGRNLTTFSNRKVFQALPCAQLITQGYIEISGGNCFLAISGLGNYTAWNNSTAQLKPTLNQYEIVLRRSGSEYSVRIFSGEKPIITGETTLGTTNTTGNLSIIESPVCKTVIKYDSTNSIFSLRLEAISYFLNGICEQCSSHSSNEGTVLDLYDAFWKQLSSLSKYSVINWEDINVYSQCDEITDASNDCENHYEARRLCGSLLLRPKLRKCLKEKLNCSLAMLNNFRDCYVSTCKRENLRPCSDFDEYFMGCDTDEVVELQDPEFCIPTDRCIEDEDVYGI